MTIETLCAEMRKANLDAQAHAIESAVDKRLALTIAANEAEAAGVKNITKRNRMRATRFLERCCLGALGHRQDELSREARALAMCYTDAEAPQARTREAP